MFTGQNDLFFRMWYEPEYGAIDFNVEDKNEIEDGHYVPMNSGGAFRRWYGNRDKVIKFDRYYYDLITKNKGHRNPQFYFKKTAAWTKITSGKFSIRIAESGFINNDSSMAVYEKDVPIEEVVGLLNSSVAQFYLSLENESLNYTTGNVASIPMKDELNDCDRIIEIVKDCVSLSKEDWDSFETSWDFETHPLIKFMSFAKEERESDAMYHIVDMNYIKEAYINWSNECYLRFQKLKQNEESINRIFIENYGLQAELTAEVEEKDVTVRKADLQRDIRSFISYAVGCMFGRYSLDVPGVVYAGGEWDVTRHTTFKPDEDAIIPICDDEYFDDDIVGRFIQFVEVVYGKETLEENLQFIADAVGGKGSSREVIRNYFINDFYADHVKIYKKRPIYWLFDSGKKNGFKCLIYMHRYQPDTIARIRTDYVHEQQARYRTAIEEITNRIENASGSDKVKLTKKLNTLKSQNDEIHAYEEKIHHLADQMISIDLDDGVKKNYEIFKDVLAKISRR